MDGSVSIVLFSKTSFGMNGLMAFPCMIARKALFSVAVPDIW